MSEFSVGLSVGLVVGALISILIGTNVDTEPFEYKLEAVCESIDSSLSHYDSSEFVCKNEAIYKRSFVSDIRKNL